MWRNLDLREAGILLVVCAASAVACGPGFPNRLLENGDAAVSQAPVAMFEQEIARIVPRNTMPFESRGMPNDELQYRETVKRFDMDEVKEAMRHGAGFSEEEFAAYQAAREAIFKYDAALSAWDGRSVTVQRPEFVAPVVPDGRGSSREFSAYLKGAVLWYQGRTNDAVRVWNALIDLPADERRHRSTWAAFMLGKAQLGRGEEEKAIASFRSVRRLVQDGFDDSLGLAASSLGWEARAELNRQNSGQAIELYLTQLATGDSTALNSLRFAAAGAWRLSAKKLAELVKQESARKVLVAYALSHDAHGGPSLDVQKIFLSAVETAGIPVVEEADRLAWAAYRAGDMEMAGRFLAVAPRDSVMTLLVGAKLLLRKGKEKQAMEELSRIVRSFPESPTLNQRYSRLEDPSWELNREPLGKRLRGELGVLRLSRREFVQSLDLLLRGGYWQDAAYVAERVLTPGELQEYVDSNWTMAEYATVEEELKSSYRRGMGSQSENIRYLLGRRLVRAGEMEKARPYLPPSLRPVLEAYVRHLRVGNDETAIRKRRADALWKAACIARYSGMELMGTELDPDWAVYGGEFLEEDVSETRAKPDFAERVKPSSLEMERVKRSAPFPNSRFHYRAVAVDLAWRAARLMPDESAQTADVLCTAGGWLKKNDPEGADRFYKALVKRCGKTTELGKQADKLRWFPEQDVDRWMLLKDATETR